MNSIVTKRVGVFSRRSLASAFALSCVLGLAFGVPASAQTSGPTTTTVGGAPGSIAGRVTAQDTGQPIAGICASASQVGGTGVTSAKTGSDGTYTITGVAPDRYKVKFHDCTNAAYADQFFNGKADNVSADVLTIAAGQHLSGINAVMTRTVAPTAGTPSGTPSVTGSKPSTGGATSRGPGTAARPLVSPTGLARTGRPIGLMTLVALLLVAGGSALVVLAGSEGGAVEPRQS